MKECYGNYMEYPICRGHNSCQEEGCRHKTNFEKGNCECEFKKYCHLTRQWLQGKFKEENPNRTKRNCDFYHIFLEQQDK